jgi:hypothetical protein
VITRNSPGRILFFLAHHVVRTLSCMAASGRSRRKTIGRPRLRRGRALSRGRATARPSPQAVSAHSGHDRSAKNIGGLTLLASKTPTIRTGALVSPAAAPWQPHQLISGRALTARTKILHTRGSSAPRWMGLVSRTAGKANPASSVTHPSRLWPGSVGQTPQRITQQRLRRSVPSRSRRIARVRSPACAPVL